MIVFLLGKILQIVLSVAQIRLTTMMLSPNQYGELIVLQTIVSLFILFTISPIGLYLNRHVHEWDHKGHMAEAFYSYTALLFSISLAGSVVYSAAVLTGIIDGSLMLVGVLTLLTFAQVFFQTWVPTFNLVGRPGRFILGTNLGIILSIALAIVSIKMISTSSHVWVMGVSFGFILTTLLFIPFQWWNTRREKVGSFIRSLSLSAMISYSRPLILFTILIWAQTQGYRFVAESKVGIEAFGLFAAGYAVVSGLFASLEGVMSSFYQPRFYRNLAQGREISSEMAQIWELVTYPYLLAMVFLYWCSKDVAQLFLDSKFLIHSDWISWAAFAEFSRVLFNTMSFHFQADRKTYQIVLPQLIGVGLTFGLLFLRDQWDFYFLIKAMTYGNLLSFTGLFLLRWSCYRSLNVRKMFAWTLLSIAYFGWLKWMSTLTFGVTFLVLSVGVGFLFAIPYLKIHRKDLI